MTYQEIDYEYFKTKRLIRKYARNTYLIKTLDSIQVLYHGTIIFEITKNNDVTFDTGSWNSKTIERFTPPPRAQKPKKPSTFFGRKLTPIQGGIDSQGLRRSM